jgi:hypothetical protein
MEFGYIASKLEARAQMLPKVAIRRKPIDELLLLKYRMRDRVLLSPSKLLRYALIQ